MAESLSPWYCHTSHTIRRDFVSKCSSRWQSTGQGSENMVGNRPVMNHRNCTAVRTLARMCVKRHRNCIDPEQLGNGTYEEEVGKTAWDQELRTIDCEFCIMRWCLLTKGFSKSIPPTAQSISINPCSQYASALTTHHSVSLRYPNRSICPHRHPPAILNRGDREKNISPLQLPPTASQSHPQKVKLVSKNGPHVPIILHILHNQSEWLISNLPPGLKTFNDVITSSPHLKNIFSHFS